MNAKKHIARFTIKFDLTDPQHQQAMQILNRAGRRKAERITKALLFYERNGGEEQHLITPQPLNLPPADNIDDDLWENINESLENGFGF